MLTDTERRAVRTAYRKLRGRLALTQTETAAAAKIHRTALSKIEAGKIAPTPEQRRALARALRVKVADVPSFRRAA